MFIFHITNQTEWEKAQKKEAYEGDTLQSEGFIHCSRLEQIIPVANRMFKHQNDLLILCINDGKLEVPVKYENLEGGNTLFPHVYGVIPLDAVEQAVQFPPQINGEFLLPDALQIYGN